MTMTLISRTTLGSTATSIDLTSIPGTFTDLVIKASLRTTESATTSSHYINFNGVTTNRSMRTLQGSGSAAASGSTSDGYVMPINANSSTASTFTSIEYYIPNYAGSTNKTISIDGVMENNATASYQAIDASLWSSTAAITQVNLTAGGNNFAIGSTVSIYGILKGSGGATVS